MNIWLGAAIVAAVGFAVIKSGSGGDINDWDVLDPIELMKSKSLPEEIKAKIVASLSGPVKVGDQGAVIMRKRSSDNLVEAGVKVLAVSGENLQVSIVALGVATAGSPLPPKDVPFLTARRLFSKA